MKNWVHVDVVSVEYAIDLESEEFKEDETEIQFGVRKEQHGPVVYEELSTVEIIVDKYLPDSFILDMTKHSEDYVIKRKSLQSDM
eukprot:10439978-Ditylum_brightwellii.AAC.1